VKVSANDARRRRKAKLLGERISEDIHRLAKMDAALHGERLNDWIEDAALEKLIRRGVLKGTARLGRPAGRSDEGR